MKKLITNISIFLIAGAQLLSAATTAEALKKPIKALTINRDEVYMKYHKAIESHEKIAAATQQANTELQKMYQEGIELGKNYDDLLKKSRGETLSDKAKQEYNAKAEEVGQQIRKKQEELIHFQQSTNQTLAQRTQSIRTLHKSEINKVIASMAKKYDVNFVFNISSEDSIIDSDVLYSNPDIDITEEVLAELNKDAKKAAPENNTKK